MPAASAQADRVSASISVGIDLRNSSFFIFDTPRMSDGLVSFGCGGVHEKELTVEALAARLDGDGAVAAVGAEQARLDVVAQVGVEQHVLQIILQAGVAD